MRHADRLVCRAVGLHRGHRRVEVRPNMAQLRNVAGHAVGGAYPVVEIGSRKARLGRCGRGVLDVMTINVTSGAVLPAVNDAAGPGGMAVHDPGVGVAAIGRLGDGGIRLGLEDGARPGALSIVTATRTVFGAIGCAVCCGIRRGVCAVARITRCHRRNGVTASRAVRGITGLVAAADRARPCLAASLLDGNRRGIGLGRGLGLRNEAVPATIVIAVAMVGILAAIVDARTDQSTAGNRPSIARPVGRILLAFKPMAAGGEGAGAARADAAAD